MRRPAELTRWLLLFLALAALTTRTAFAQYPPSNYPSWWSSYGVLSGTTPDDYAVAAQGQAKNMAVAADAELDNDLAQFGGAGNAVDQLAATLSGTSSLTDDFLALDLGQLKSIVQPFYDQLLSIGYKAGPLASGTYPWVASGLSANDFAVANLGQLKYLFSFDVTYSSPGNGIPDWWVQKYFPGSTIDGQTGVDPNAPLPGNSGETYSQAYQSGSNPIFYADQPLNLVIVSGNNQTGPPGGYLPSPLVVKVTDANGNAITGAPLSFQVSSAGGYIQAVGVASGSTSAIIPTDANGQGEVYFGLPSGTNANTSVTVSTGAGANSQQVTFNASSDNGTGQFTAPFAPSSCFGSVNGDGSYTFGWTNNTNGIELYIVIQQQQSDGTWQTVSPQLPAGTTSYILASPSGTGQYQIDAHTPDALNPGDDPDFPSLVQFSIPVAVCAVVDMSGNLTTNVDLVSIDDDDAGNFEFWDGNNYAVYNWSGGTAELEESVPEVVPVAAYPYQSGTETLEAFSPGILTPDGTLYGMCGTIPDNLGFEPTPKPPYVLGEQPALGTSGTFQGELLDFYDAATDDVYTYENAYYSGLVDAAGSNYCGTIGWDWPFVDWPVDLNGSTYDVSSSWEDETMYEITGGAPEEIFLNAETLLQSDPTPSNMQLSGFEPAEINSGGFAIGTNAGVYDQNGNWIAPPNASNPYDYWDGYSLTSLPGTPAGINEENYVTGSLGAAGYLWINNYTYLLTALVPPPYQGELTNINPFQISNDEGDGCNILFSANYRDPTPGAATSGTFMLHTDGVAQDSTIQQIILPQGVNLAPGYRILNSDGCMAGIGTPAGGTGQHALFLVPITFDVTNWKVTTTNPIVQYDKDAHGNITNVYIDSTADEMSIPASVSISVPGIYATLANQIASQWDVYLYQNVIEQGVYREQYVYDIYQFNIAPIPGEDTNWDLRDPSPGSGEYDIPQKRSFTANDQTVSMTLEDSPSEEPYAYDHIINFQGVDMGANPLDPLFSVKREDQFITWLFTQNRITGQRVYLKWVQWKINHDVNFNFTKTNPATINSLICQPLSSGDGMGATAPVDTPIKKTVIKIPTP